MFCISGAAQEQEDGKPCWKQEEKPLSLTPSANLGIMPAGKGEAFTGFRSVITSEAIKGGFGAERQ